MIVNDPATMAEVTVLFRAYEAALMANDVAALNAFFWQSSFTLRYGAGENLYGADAIRGFRKARIGGSPQRQLDRTIITTFGTGFGTASTEFHREGESRLGRQSQVWVRLLEGWRIVAAHVSLIGETS